MPMMYHRYEGQPVEWLVTATKEELILLPGNFHCLADYILHKCKPQELGLATSLSRRPGPPE